ncbi:MAG: AAA family ATPase [Gammaproteobacteria bacterium]|jgi:predicted kinase
MTPESTTGIHAAIVVCGSPGAGKTTYARRLAAARHAVLLDIDTVTERLVRIALGESGHSEDDRDSGYFKRTFREPIYETLFAIARENLPVQEVIIVGPFTREIRDPDWPSKLERNLGGPVEVHYVQCAPDIRRHRLERRGDARDLAKLNEWDSYIRYYGDEHPPVFAHVLVAGSTPAEYMAQAPTDC